MGKLKQQNVFFDSNKLQLKFLPSKKTKKIEILKIISEKFEFNKVYNETEVNEILKEIYHDYVIIRRMLIDYNFLKRNKSGTKYEKVLQDDYICNNCNKTIKGLIVDFFGENKFCDKKTTNTKLLNKTDVEQQIFNFLLKKGTITFDNNFYFLNYDSFDYSFFNIQIKKGSEFIIKNTITGNIIKSVNYIQNFNDINHFDFLSLYRLGLVVPNFYNEYDDFINGFLRNLQNNKTLCIMIVPTLECNFKCVYCYENGISRDETIAIDNLVDSFRFLNNYIKEKEISYVNFVIYGGEPTLANLELLNEMTHQINKLECKYSSKIITNGFILNLNIITFLKNINVQTIQITLDGPKEIHDKLRMLNNNTGSFTSIIHNIKLIVREKIVHNIILRINCSTYNINYIEELLNYLHDEFENNLNMFSLSLGLLSFGLNENTNKIINDISISNNIDKYCELFKIAKKLGFNISTKYCVSNLCMNKINGSIMIAPNNKFYKCMKAIGHSELQCDIKSIDEVTIKKEMLDECKIKHCQYIPYCYLGCLMEGYISSGKMKKSCKYNELDKINKRLLYELY